MLNLCDGRRLAGRIESIGADYAAVASEDGSLTLVILRGIATVTGRAQPVAGERMPQLSQTLRAVLVDWAADQPEVIVGLVAGAEPVTGSLVNVGVDVAALRTLARDNATTHVVLASVLSVALR